MPKKGERSERRRQVVDLYLYGFETTEIAKMFDIKYGIIQTLLKRDGVKLRPHPIGDRRIYAVETEDLQRDYNLGLSIRQLERKYGMGWTAIRMRLIRAGTKMRPKGTPPGSMNLPLKELEKRRFLYETMDMTLEEVAIACGLKPSAASAVSISLKKMGVAIREGDVKTEKVWRTTRERYSDEYIATQRQIRRNRERRTTFMWAIREEQKAEDDWTSSEDGGVVLGLQRVQERRDSSTEGHPAQLADTG